MNVLPQVTKLSPRVIRILGCNPGPMTLQGTNTYLIGTGPRRILLDTGDGEEPEYLDLLKSVLKEHHITLDHIVLTHWHEDHVGGVGPIQKSVEKCCRVSKFPVAEHPTDYEPLADGQSIVTEGANLKVYHTPGHTTDHVVLHLEEENAVFSGDCILGEGTAVFEDLYDYMKSLQQILKLEPEVIYPGHGPTIDDPVPRISYYINHRQQREAQVMENLNQSRGEALTAMDLVRRMYQDLDPTLYPAAEHNVLMHLHKLVKEGRVRRTAPNGGQLWSSI